MIPSYRPADAELMLEARRTLHERIRHTKPPGDSARLSQGYGGPASDVARTDQDARRRRSLQTCHRPALLVGPRFVLPEESGAYVPEMAARLDDDRNLTDGARRCARKIAEVAYRQSRENRVVEITVTYLMKALGRCRRSVQNYLRQLERGDYIKVDVVCGSRSRMCVGLAVHLLGPLFPRHHRERWPENRRTPGAQKDSHKNRFLDQIRKNPVAIPRQLWALRCMDGVFRSLKAALPPCPALSAAVS